MNPEQSNLCLNYVIGEDFNDGIRVDKYLAEQSGDFSRSQLKQRISRLLVNGKEVKLSRKIFPGDRITVEQTPLPPSDLVAENIPLDVLYEDEDVIVINKPAGLVVHPGSGNYRGTVVNALLFRYNNLRENFADEELRPGIVHRLDKDTSGVLLAARHTRALEKMAAQFRRRQTSKKYIALVKGSPPQQEGVLEMALKRDPHQRKKFTGTENGGKTAITYYSVLKFFTDYTLVLLRPRTGRTHQLRVHMQHLGCPILGDPVYSRRDSRFPEAGLMLHAWQLSVKLPVDNQLHTFTAPPPPSFDKFCHLLGWDGLREKISNLCEKVTGD